MSQRGQQHISITFMSGPLDGKTVAWDYPTRDSEIVLTIGRRDGCDIALDYDSQVSRLHARLAYVPDESSFTLEDAGSRNGTFIGSDRLTSRMALTPGVLFRVGRTWLRLDRPHDEDGDEGEE